MFSEWEIMMSHKKPRCLRLTQAAICSLIALLIASPSFAEAAEANGSKGGMQDFLNDLRNFESGINPSLHDYYVENRNKPIYTYAQVTKPGHIVRDCKTGAYIPEPTTIQQFFEKIGVYEMWDPSKTGSDRKKMYRKMQYKSMNAWGFVGGYQMGEALLVDAGYYSPLSETIDGTDYDSLYMFIDDSNWIGCKSEKLVEIEGSGGNMVFATTINNWKGTFVGKNGIFSFDDLMHPQKQELVIRDAMRFNYDIMTGLFEKASISWEDALSKTWRGKDGKKIQATMSGLLAAAHLRGAWGTADLIIKGAVTSDELGTAITDYIHKFGGYSTLFDTPGNDIIWGSKHDETMSAGLGNDIVKTGGGKNTILLHEFPGSITSVLDFTLGDDRIILRDWTNPDPLRDLKIVDTGSGAKLAFSDQTVLLKGINANQVKSMPATVIQKSDVYTLGWTGKHTANDFDAQLDIVRGSSGIAFKDLKAYEAGGSLYIGVMAGDGGIYSHLQLVGMKLDDLHPGMFEHVSGSFDRLGYIVPLGWQNWGWGNEIDVSSFDADKTVISMGIFKLSFGELTMDTVGNDVVISLAGSAGQDDGRKVILRNVDAASLSAKNFLGVSGSFHNLGVLSGGGLDSSISLVPNLVPKEGSETTAGSNGCPEAWTASQIYEGGDVATYEGIEYKAKWWTEGGPTPDQAGEWGVWERLGECKQNRRNLRRNRASVSS